VQAFWRLLCAPGAAVAFGLAMAPSLAVLLLGAPGLPNIAADPVWATAAVRSLLLTELALAIGLPVGLAAALALWGGRPVLRRLGLGLAAGVMLAPAPVLGAGLADITGRMGFAGAQVTALVLAHGAAAAALTLFILTARLNDVDPRILLAAASGGAPTGLAWRVAVLPALAWPLAVSAACCIAFSVGQAGLDARLEAARHPTLDVLGGWVSTLGGAAAPPAMLLLAGLAAAPLLVLLVGSLLRVRA
jgi:ABC-type spermidine/putrescine transport system permease subunit II